MTKQLIVCESTATITTHLRSVTSRPAAYGGHALPRPASLCGTPIAWDTRLPVTSTRCKVCRELAGLDGDCLPN
jgi:hypothetical protein